MREDNLLCLRKRGFVRTTDSGHDLGVWLNLAARLELTGIDQLWVADITYIRLAEEFVFLAVVLDAFSRRVLAGRWASAGRRAGYRRAASGHRPAPTRAGLAHHSDRGVQYASGAYVNLLLEHGIQPSMSRAGNPYDNAKCESFMKTLKQEEIYTASIATAPIWRLTSRVPRAVLQSQTAALGARLPLAGAVRAKPVPPTGSGAGRKHEFFQA